MTPAEEAAILAEFNEAIGFDPKRTPPTPPPASKPPQPDPDEALLKGFTPRAWLVHRPFHPIWTTDAKYRAFRRREARKSAPTAPRQTQAAPSLPMAVDKESQEQAFLPLIDHARCVVITLAKSPERLRRFWELFPSDWPLERPIVHYGVDGAVVPMPKGWKATPGAYGCQQSFLQVVDQAIADNLQSALILFEDDAQVVAGGMDRIKYVLASIPEKADMVWLGVQHMRPWRTVNENIVRCTPQRMQCVVILPHFFKTLAAIWRGHNSHVDHALDQCAHQHYFYAAYPAIFGQGESFSNIMHQRLGGRTWEPMVYLPSVDATKKKSTPENTALLTISAYPTDDPIRLLKQTAAKHNVPLTVLGVGTPYVSHYHSKVLRMIDWINVLDPAIEFVAYLDGKDSIVVRPMADLCRGFNSIGQDIVIACENHCWPVLNGRWQAQFSARHAGRNFPQAGFWMGKRSSILSALMVLKQIHDEIESGKATGILGEIRGNISCDQVCWQAAISSRRIQVGMDDWCQLAVTTTGLDRKIDGSGLSLVNGKVKVRDSVMFPCLMHFPGSQWVDSMKPWADALQRCKVDLVVSVLSCKQSQICIDRQENCRATWFPELSKNANISAFFIVCDPAISEPKLEGGILTLPGDDGEQTLTAKIQSAVRYALRNFDFKYFFQCSDDGYTHVQRLIEMASRLKGDCVGEVVNNHLLGGAGYFLSPRAARIVESFTEYPHGPRTEDMNVTTALIKQGIMPIHDRRLSAHKHKENWPTQTNDKITVHNITEISVMQEIHRGSKIDVANGIMEPMISK